MVAEAVSAAKQAMAREGASPQEMAAVENMDAREALNSIRRWRLSKRLAAASNSDATAGAYYVAQLYATLSQTDYAFVWLQRAFEARAPMLVFLEADPIWDGLRADARFQDLIRRVGLPK